MSLSFLGWDSFLANQFHPHIQGGLRPARVALEHKHSFELMTENGLVSAQCAGRMLHEACARSDLPAVGDWVAISGGLDGGPAAIHAVLPRKTAFSRRTAGKLAEEQVVAANVDTVLLVTGLDGNFNLRRIERLLVMAWASGAQPVVVLNKTDLHDNPAAALAEVEAIATGTPVVALSAAMIDGLDALTPWLVPARTLALLGSSGVGKSTLINRLLGVDRQPTSAVSTAVGKGRHTTTRRELILAPSGVLIIDTPGMRELQLWDPDEASLDTTFDDVTMLADSCRFRDCSHQGEPGCAIRGALESGTLEPPRWQSFQKLQRELDHAARRADPQLARETRQQWKKINKAMRVAQRMKDDWES
jgi:ribosome biogenesis GTPase